jgi:23S rRNA (adenine1618-N6)-methyltransferase
MISSAIVTLLVSLLLSSRIRQNDVGRKVVLSMQGLPRSDAHEAFGEANKPQKKGSTRRRRPGKRQNHDTSSKKVPNKKPPACVHPRNAFQGSYDMDHLVDTYPNLHPFVQPSHTSKSNRPTIDFSDPLAVRTLNAALLASDYGISQWEEFLPASSLCPPVPGRADYIHHLADVLSESAGVASERNIPTGRTIRGLDVGTGASLVYPLIGAQTYDWHFIGTDTDTTSIASARQIASANGLLDDDENDGQLNIRLQPNKRNVLRGVLSSDEEVDFVMCNPPFYESAEAYQKESDRKIRNLASNRNKRRGTGSSPTGGGTRGNRKGGASTASARKVGSNNFGGGASELWYPGGEVAFISTLIRESCAAANQCLWFSSLVSRQDNLPALSKVLDSVGRRPVEASVKDIRIVEMGQGQKSSSILLWSYHDRNEQREWCQRRGWTFVDNSR